jgi:hypothetical protein
MTPSAANGKDVLLLLGSGASPANLCIRRLTDALFSLPAVGPDHAAVLALLMRVRKDIATWNGKPITEVTYEEIGAVCSSLDKEFGTGRNAAVAPYWAELAKSLGGRSIERSSRSAGDDSLAGLILYATEWLKRGIAHELGQRVPPAGSQSIQEFLRLIASCANTWSVATLNHDCWIEAALTALDEEFCDGFARSDVLLEFHPSLLRERSDRMLVKLHGSVDWRWHPDRNNYVKVTSCTDEREIVHAYHVPELLVGTFNKLEDYSYAIYPTFSPHWIAYWLKPRPSSSAVMDSEMQGLMDGFFPSYATAELCVW